MAAISRLNNQETLMSEVKSKTLQKPAVKSKAAGGSAGPDAIELLTADHKKASALFERFEKARGQASPDEKTEMADEICEALAIHMALEEEIFYPAARLALDDDDMMNEAQIEHQGAKELMAKIAMMSGEEEEFDAAIKVLGEYIEHHVKEEEELMFPKAKKSGLDLRELGREMSLAAREALSNKGGLEGPELKGF